MGQDDEKTPKPTRKTSEAQRRAARENGKKGAEHGKKGGRPPGGLHSRKPDAYAKYFGDLREKLATIDDPLARVETLVGVLTEATLLTLEGKGNLALNQDIRAMATVIQRLIPKYRLMLAERRVLEAAAPRKPSARVASKPQPRDRKGTSLRGG